MTASERAVTMTRIAAAAADGKLATDLVALDVSEVLVLTDVFLLASGSNEPQVAAIVDEVERKLLEAGYKRARREGERGRRWVLLDYVDLVVHVQHAEERVHYALERLWKDCPTIDLQLPGPSGAQG